MKRRDFITTVAASAGSAYAAMQALDLLEKPAAAQKTPFKPQGKGRRKRIVILGAGLAGMCAAYELGKLGHDCTILEARSRAGGRCWTVRGGDEETEVGGKLQKAQFAQGQYFNPGPARIPQHHVTIDYCKELGVPLEVFTNLNQQQYYYRENAGPLSGRKIRAREALTDMRGYVSQLLAKSIGNVDAPLSTEDQEKLVEFLRNWGGLNPDLFYIGGGNRGYSVRPSAGLQPGETETPFDLSALAQYGFAGFTANDHSYNQQMTMLQPVGGMDQIAKAFEREVKQKIVFGAEVKEIRKLPNGVRIVYSDRSGNSQQIKAEYCICTIPLPVLTSIPSDFSPQMQAAINGVAYTETGKIGLQFSRRFWEEDEDILGGISRTTDDITQIFYPSFGYLSQKGLLIGYYPTGEAATRIGNLPLSERTNLALEQGSKIHSQYRSEFETAFSVHWNKIQYSLGGWANYTTQTRQQFYPRLNEPDDNIFLSGEHLSYQTGWMTGSFESARLVVSQIAALV